jgi:hypothetical protein
MLVTWMLVSCSRPYSRPFGGKGGTHEESAKKHLPALRLRVIWERVISERPSSKRSYRGGHAEARATLILDEVVA